jgi:hypothetical protein
MHQQELQLDRQEKIIAALQLGGSPVEPAHKDTIMEDGQENQHLDEDSAPIPDALDQSAHHDDVVEE